jgi:hypothetical protein
MDNTAAAKGKIALGFTYTVDHIRAGKVLGSEPVHNLIPEEGLNHAIGVLLKAETQQANWYLGLFEGDYTPTDAVTAGTVVSLATECTAYDESARPQWVGGTVDEGFVTNEDNRAVFTMNADKTIYGGFLISSSTKGSGVGKLLSIVRFPTAKDVEDGDILRLRAELTNVSAA